MKIRYKVYIGEQDENEMKDNIITEKGKEEDYKESYLKIVRSCLEQEETKYDDIPIFPFRCNNSQYQAVRRAMENQISVIQRPPGTGKTQTILNISANILMQGKTVLIVSE